MVRKKEKTMLNSIEKALDDKRSVLAIFGETTLDYAAYGHPVVVLLKWLRKLRDVRVWKRASKAYNSISTTGAHVMAFLLMIGINLFVTVAPIFMLGLLVFLIAHALGVSLFSLGQLWYASLIVGCAWNIIMFFRLFLINRRLSREDNQGE